MHLAEIKNYKEANKFLREEFLPYYNKKFERKVKSDNTIRFQGEIIQIPPSEYKTSYAMRVVEPCLLEDGKIYILYQNKVVHITKVSKDNKIYKVNKQIKKFLSKREYQPCGV